MRSTGKEVAWGGPEFCLLTAFAEPPFRPSGAPRGCPPPAPGHASEPLLCLCNCTRSDVTPVNRDAFMRGPQSKHITVAFQMFVMDYNSHQPLTARPVEHLEGQNLTHTPWIGASV
uniref:Uncharacterized protein n=1 Tax=Sphaerodactylus townsendi TaxID=933632 RepID=A0ACB8FUM0_9SAUR